MKKYASLLLLIALFSCKSEEKTNNLPKVQTSHPLIDSLNTDLQNVHKQNILPGFAVSIFTKDSIIYQKGFGYADLESQKPYTPESVQIIASITKTLIGVSLMKAVEAGQLALDDAINDHLPFKVINPHFPNVPITARHLATHTSSIDDTKKSDKGYRFDTPLLKEKFPEAHHSLLKHYNQTADISMADFLKLKLSFSEKWYEKEVFTTKEPGTHYEYSNLGATLLAYIIELKTGQSFSDYTNTHIIKPLKMNSSTWNLDKIDSQKQVTYYNEILNSIPNYHIISYPDGGLYSSVTDLTKYLQEMIKGYDGESKLLQKKSFREIMRKQYEGEELTDGLCWDLSFPNLIGHSGNDFGTATLMYFSPKTGIGRILFTNISIEKEEQENAFYGIFNILFAYQFFKETKIKTHEEWLEREYEKQMTLAIHSDSIDLFGISSTLPDDFYIYSNVKYIRIGCHQFNCLTSLSPKIKNFKKLKSLTLSKTSLKELPKQIGELSTLKHLLVLGGGQLESVPKEIGQLTNLETLDLWRNKLTSLPNSIQKLTKLKILYIGENNFSKSEIKRIKQLLPNCKVTLYR
ncbi:MAG: serine hydrolase [Chitinophagales bacterium]